MSKFESKLYLFGDVYDPRLEDVFGLGNMEIHKLRDRHEISDETTERLKEMVTTFYRTYQYLIIVKYEAKLVTSLIMMGLDYKVFWVRSTQAQERLKELEGMVLKLAEVYDSSNSYFEALERALNYSESVLANSTYNDLRQVNNDIAHYGDIFDGVITNGICEVLVENYGISI